MFKLRYNLLVAVQVILSLLNATLLINVFGVSAEADTYLMAVNIIISLQFLELMMTEQFTQFYNDIKAKDTEDAKRFYNAALFFTICIGLTSFVIFTLGTNIITCIFAKNMDIQRHIMLTKLLKILFIGSAVMPIVSLNERLFVAEMKISVSYILQIIQILSVVIAQILLIIINSKNVEFLAWALALGRIAATMVSMYFALKIIPFKLNFWHPNIKPFVKNSIVIKFGDNLSNFVLPAIVNNVLASLGTGVASYYYYALKIVDILNNISIGPSSKVLKSKISEYMAKLRFNEIKKISKSFLINMSLIFIGGIIVAYFGQKPILKLISNNKLTDFDLKNIAYIFLALAGYYYFKLIEYPYLTVNITAKKGKTVVAANGLFVLGFAALTFILIKYIGIYSIPVSMFIAEFVPFFIYIKKSNALLYNKTVE